MHIQIAAQQTAAAAAAEALGHVIALSTAAAMMPLLPKQKHLLPWRRDRQLPPLWLTDARMHIVDSNVIPPVPSLQLFGI
jgi:hypothetical protein